MVLKHRDRTLLHFAWTDFDAVRIDFVDEDARRLLPLSFGRAAFGEASALERALAAWLCRRTAPMGRHFMRDLMFSLGLNMRDPDFHRKALDFSLGLSLNDVYWVTPDDFRRTWAECNLYDNAFSESMAEIAFTGYGVRAAAEATTSPEMTTNGMLPKCWRRVGGEILLYKAGTAASAAVKRTVGLEPYSEYFAAQVAEALGFPHVDYDLARFKGRLCSTCRLFTSARTGYLPAAQVEDRRAVLSDPRFAEVFLFDAVIFNTDRHLGNFGYLVDNDTNEIVGAAPIFDNGYGLLSLMASPTNASVDGLAYARAYLRDKRPALFDRWLGFPGVAALPLRSYAERLRGFRFRRHHHYNPAEDRVSLIARVLQKRVFDILEYLDKADEYLDVSESRVGVNSKSSAAGVGVSSAGEAAAAALVGDPFALQVLWNLQRDPLMTLAELATTLGRETRTVERRVRKLREAGFLRRAGSDKTGAWEVLLRA